MTGGAYIGVGPDQNFSYIAQVKPAIAFIMDLRRDNLLLHLLFKALFSMADTRADYLSLLFGRPAPPRRTSGGPPTSTSSPPVDARLAGPEPAGARRREDQNVRRAALRRRLRDHRSVSPAVRDRGPAAQVPDHRPGAASYYPTYRDLLLETDRQGRRWSFLASEDDYQFVRSLERRDLVIPVVGDLAELRRSPESAA